MHIDKSYRFECAHPDFPYASATVDCRTTKEQGRRHTPRTRLPPIMSSRRSPASRPSARRFMSTLVKGGRAASAITSQLSKPAIATSFGTDSPRSRSASASPPARGCRGPGELVVAAEQRTRRRLAAVEQAADRLAAPGLGPDAGKIESIRCRELGRLEPGEIAGLAQPDGLEVFGAGDVRD